MKNFEKVLFQLNESHDLSENLSKIKKVLFLMSLTILTLGCSKKDDSNDSAAQIFTASFRLTGDGYNETVNYNSEDNLIFCRITDNEMWIRLARDKINNGGGGPHIDIDICNYAGTGTYTPVDPQNRPCPGGMLWDIFWHDGVKIYSNTATSSPCQLTLNLNGDILTGLFSCSEVVRFQGTEMIEISQGSFTCKVE